MVFAVRGAIQVRTNTETDIADASARLVREMCGKNAIAEDEIVSIVFSVTEELTAGNPAAGLRRVGFSETPLFCVQEARWEGGMPRVIRVLLTAESENRTGREAGRETSHIYLDGAEALRPDLKE
jgi:chorismate mutase